MCVYTQIKAGILLGVEVKSHAELLRSLFCLWHSLLVLACFFPFSFCHTSKRPPSSQEVVVKGLQTCLGAPATFAVLPSGLADCILPVSREEAGFKGNKVLPHALLVFYAAASVFRSHEKKHKVSEDLPEAEGTSEKAGDDCGDSSCLPMDEKPLSEQPKESDPGRGEGKPNPVPLDTGQKDSLSPSRSQAGDHTESSTGTHAPRWDFTTINLPNVAPDQPCTRLPSPDNGLLPENVPGREVDAACWCARINQKQEKLSRKEREQRERESRYKSSVNADREVRRCSNWQEYKALLEQRSQQRVWRRPPHLWDQAITPLLQPDEATSSGNGSGNLTGTPFSPPNSVKHCLVCNSKRDDMEKLNISLGDSTLRRRISLEGLGKAGTEEPSCGHGKREQSLSSAFPSLSIAHSSARINRALGGLLIHSPCPTVLQSFLLGC